MTPEAAFLVVAGPPPLTRRRLLGGAPRLFIFNLGSSVPSSVSYLCKISNLLLGTHFRASFQTIEFEISENLTSM